MADQINMRANSTAPPALFQPFKNNNIFRLDEGYSEETRSQAGSELPIDARMSEVMDADGSLPSLLPEWTGNMNESARSGMFLCIYFISLLRAPYMRLHDGRLPAVISSWNIMSENF